MRLIHICIYIALSFPLGFCIQSATDQRFLLFPEILSENKTSHELLWFYGLSNPEEIRDSDSFFQYDPKTLDFCFLSLPEFLFFNEQGIKFRLCLKNVPLPLVNEIQELMQRDILFSKNLGEVHFFRLRQGEWENLKEESNLVEEWNLSQGNQNLKLFSTFFIPKGNLTTSVKKECFFTYPKFDLRNQNFETILKFPCDFPKEKVEKQNLSWLQNCEEGVLSFSEFFRHSESAYNRYMEFANLKNTPLCPGSKILTFQDESGKTTSQWVSLPLLLPHSLLVLVWDSKALGIPMEGDLASKIGNKGIWKWDEKPFFSLDRLSFLQGEEFFSWSENAESCSLQRNVYKTKEKFCGNPGLPNRTFASQKLISENPPCSPEDIILTEYFPGESQDLPAYLEFQNQSKQSCDISNLELDFEGDWFPLAAEKREVRAGELFLISRFSFEGWGFLSLQKSISDRRRDFGIPQVLLRSRRNSSVFRLPDLDFTPLYKEIGGETFSLGRGKNANYQVSPHSPGIAEDSFFIDTKLGRVSEVFLESSFDGFTTAPEDRFIELQFSKESEGVISFQIDREGYHEQFQFFKRKEKEWVFFSNRPRRCLGTGFGILPDNALRNEPTQFQVGRDIWRYERTFSASANRRSIHPERDPFRFSFSRNQSLLGACSPFTFATPGNSNAPENQIRSVPGLDFASYIFLENPQSITFQMGNGALWDFPSQEIYEPSSIFSEKEVLLSRWEFDSQSAIRLHRKGALEIVSFSRHPQRPQNEWIRFCNRSKEPIPVNGLVFRDENSSDFLVPYRRRFSSGIPKFQTGFSYQLAGTELLSGQCAILIDPDGSDWIVYQSLPQDLILTIASGGTLGNGLGNRENFHIFSQFSGRENVLGFFGMVPGLSLFRIEQEQGTIVFLLPGEWGDEASHYAIIQEEEVR